MKEIFAFETEEGAVVFVEAEAAERGETELVARGDRESKPREAGRFEDVLSHVRPAAQAVVNAFREINTPEEIQLEFAMSFKAGANAFVFTSGTEATFKVALTWKNSRGE